MEGAVGGRQLAWDVPKGRRRRRQTGGGKATWRSLHMNHNRIMHKEHTTTSHIDHRPEQGYWHGWGSWVHEMIDYRARTRRCEHIAKLVYIYTKHRSFMTLDTRISPWLKLKHKGQKCRSADRLTHFASRHQVQDIHLEAVHLQHTCNG